MRRRKKQRRQKPLPVHGEQKSSPCSIYTITISSKKLLHLPSSKPKKGLYLSLCVYVNTFYESSPTSLVWFCEQGDVLSSDVGWWIVDAAGEVRFKKGEGHFCEQCSRTMKCVHCHKGRASTVIREFSMGLKNRSRGSIAPYKVHTNTSLSHESNMSIAIEVTTPAEQQLVYKHV